MISMDDDYFDDPIKDEPSPRRKAPGILASILILLAGGLFLNTTLAGNIRINSGVSAEFGQGIAVTTACAGSSVLTMTPISTFINSSGGGSFYFSSVSVSGIPTSCNGVDFTISAYSDTGNALPLFNTTSTIASIWDNGNSFQGGKGWIGSSITSGSGSFTVSFNAPVALASSVTKISLQSLGHQAGSCITENICAVGDTGPGGGPVFYVGAAFTETGTVCNTNCHYLELAPIYWYNNPEPVGQLAPISSIPPTTSALFGAGWSNTNTLTAYANNTTAVYAAVRYGAATGTVGQWFLASTQEMDALYYSPIHAQLTPDWYWTSEYRGGCAEYAFPRGWGGGSGYSQPFYSNCVNGQHSVRPIRAF